VLGFLKGSSVGLRVVSLKLDEAVLEEVEAIAREEGVSFGLFWYWLVSGGFRDSPSPHPSGAYPG